MVGGLSLGTETGDNYFSVLRTESGSYSLYLLRYWID